MKPPTRVELARFHRLVAKRSDGCWFWTGPHGTKDGYGHFRPGPGQPQYMTHRWAYEAFVGPIADGMQLDHLCHTADESCPGGPECRHRRCCNPAHLEQVSGSENTIRQRHAERAVTQCPKGHPYDDENTIVNRDGKRRCRTCDRQRKRKVTGP